MKKHHIFSSAFLLAASISADAADFDKSIPIICSLSNYSECTIDGCDAVSAASLQAPTFIRINARKKTLKAYAQGKTSESKVSSVEIIDGKLILAGIEDGAEDVRDGVGYSASVTIETGNLVLTAVSDDLAIMAYGACIRD